jgi:peptide methionine sulfoxide reductase msrA/msrB
MIKKYHELTDLEDQIINHKGTEPSGTGLYNNLDQAGIYLCRKCDQPLFLSNYKFTSFCGWPSFDQEIEGAVKNLPDPDGMRVEIQCSRCSAHLGHVFEGERFTSKNIRHCVNSSSLRFIKTYSEEGYQRAYFACGCFWGVQYFFDKFQGVVKTRVGFMGGESVYPTYQELINHNTGHFEVIEVLFDGMKVSYEELAKLFFEIHNPSQEDGQGPDIGPQYRSCIFFMTLEQKHIAQTLMEKLKKNNVNIVTLLKPASNFYPADEYHQHYYEKNLSKPYCHKRIKKFT